MLKLVVLAVDVPHFSVSIALRYGSLIPLSGRADVDMKQDMKETLRAYNTCPAVNTTSATPKGI